MSLTRSVNLTLWKRKTLLKETKHLNKWNATHVCGWEGLLLLRWGDSPNSSTELRRSHQSLSWHLRRKGQANPKIHMEIQGAQKSQNNIDKEQSWGARTSWFPKRPQSSSSQDSVALAHGQTRRCRRSESLEINPGSTDFQQQDPGSQQRSFHNLVLGPLGIPPRVTDWRWTPPHTKLKVNQRLTVRATAVKLWEGNIAQVFVALE